MKAAAGARGRVLSATSPQAFGLWLAAAVGAGAAMPLGLPFLDLAPAPAALPDTPPRFALTAPDGSRITDRSLAGAPYVLVFGYTRCGAPCHDRLARVIGWRARSGQRASAVRVVFVSVDPGHDTPARMAAFAARAPGPVLALTGPRPAVTRAVAAFNTFAFAAKLCGGGTFVAHSGATYLVDSNGRLQAALAQNASDTDALAKLRALAAS